MSPPAPEKYFGVRFYFQVALCLDIQRTQVHARQSTPSSVVCSVADLGEQQDPSGSLLPLLFSCTDSVPLYPQHLLVVPCQIPSLTLDSEDKGCQIKHKSPSHLKLQVLTFSGGKHLSTALS